MAAASKSDGAESKKKSSMPRIFLGLWLVALTVLLVILFTNMPEQREGTAGRPLIKKISAPAPEELKSLMSEKADKQAVDRLEGRVDDIARKSDDNGKEIAVLDQRVNRLENTVSDQHRLPDESFPEITPPEPESAEPAPPEEGSGQTPPETAKEKPAEEPDPTVVKKPIEIDANLPVPPRPAKTADAATAAQAGEQPSEAPATSEKGATPSGQAAGTSEGEAGSDAGPSAPSPTVVQKETPADRRSVEEKIAAREAYIRRTAPQRRAAPWETPADEPDRAGIASPAPGRWQREGIPGGVGVRPPRSPGRGHAGIGMPAGSLHRFSQRFGHRVDLSKRLEGRDESGADDPDMAGTAPGMTIFRDRRLGLPGTD